MSFCLKQFVRQRSVLAPVRTGQTHTKEWMESNCKFVLVENELQPAMRDFAQLMAKIAEDGGQVQLGFYFDSQPPRAQSNRQI